MAGRYTYQTSPTWIKPFIDLGFPYNSDAYRPVALRLVDRLYGFAGGTRLMGAAAAEVCYIAAGRFEARIEAWIDSLGYSGRRPDPDAGRR